jgi:hypothetical protein
MELSMHERRSQPRLTDAELAMIAYDEKGMIVRQLANVEDISLNGAGMIVDHAVGVGTAVTMTYGQGELAAVVRHCTALVEGHFIRVEFAQNGRDSDLHFQPELFTSAVQQDSVSRSTTVLPVKIITPFSSVSATGSSCQCTKSRVTA